ncbi:MAG: hypothetical protein IK149_01695 [Oscillospiraceae bacterium]|nr:hypothetical protein [Oscillospiraceae bacterium]
MRDWTEIETMYVAGDMSLQALAEQTGISYSTVSKHASAGKWSEKRQGFRKKAENKALERARARISAKLLKLAESTELAIDAALQALNDPEQFRRYIVTEGCGEGVSATSEKIFQKTDTKALRDMAAALRDLTALQRNIYGLKTSGEKVSEKIARERLKLEQKKVEHAIGDEDGGESGVILIPERRRADEEDA